MRYSLIASTAAAVLSCSQVVLGRNHAHDAYLQRRQAALSTTLSASSSSPTGASSGVLVSAAGSSSSSSSTSSSSAAVPSISRAPALQHMTATDPDIPPLGPNYHGRSSSISRTFELHIRCRGHSSPQRRSPTTDSSHCAIAWIAEVQAKNPNIPLISQTKDGSCAGDPELAKQGSASGNCWWTCGGCTRPTDITVCPDKMSWGLTYDDGPSPYTPKLLHFLDEHDLNATFYVVGSRVISRPEMVQYEYMQGHEISVHTWSHHPLTTLTNEQIIAELGWTRKAIRDVTGVTPLTMRPPYGDIDDRVRAISMAMDLTPVIWTGVGKDEFDTSDWRIPGGTANGTSSYAAFNRILEKATIIDTGFIVLQHDLYQETVDLAVGYILPDALAHVPKFSLSSVSHCLHQPLEDAYVETNTNETIRTTAAGGIGLKNSGMKTGAQVGFQTTALIGLAGVLVLLFA
ncbi:hypothetical protein OPQ81_007971 [Rhizoctonia solani]|nr:hypothetical protein OPQ81_007971 [Rhizoctonia solani]